MSVRNNDYITYDLTTHRYCLTEKCLRDKLGIDLTSLLDSAGDVNIASLSERWLKDLSRDIYSYIYVHAKNKNIIEYKMAMETDWVDCLQEAMEMFAFSRLLDNNNINLESGIDLEKGKKTERSDLTRSVVPIGVENVLRNGGLLYRGYYANFDMTLLETKGVDY